MNIDSAILLFAIWVALLLTPGPDFVLMLQTTTINGQRSGIITGLGITAGLSIYIFITIIGLGVLLENSALYDVLMIAGAIYLIYLGVRILVSVQEGTSQNVSTCHRNISNSKAFVRGLLCNLLNPKAPILITSIFVQIIPKDADYVVRTAYGLEIVLTNLIVWSAFASLIKFPFLKYLLVIKANLINCFSGISLSLLGLFTIVHWVSIRYGG